MRAALPIGAAALAAALLAAPFSAGAPAKAKPRCAASRNDVLCVVHSLVRVGHGRARPKVKAGTARLVSQGSTIQLTKKGVANVYLGRAAQCQDLSLSKPGTALRTRTPHTFVFKQLRGDALCTMGDGRIILVEAGEKVARVAARGSSEKAQKFFASVEVEAPRVGSAEFRLRYYPRKVFAVATHGGAVRVRLSTGEVLALPAGRELDVTLRPDGSFGSRKLGLATFSAREAAVFAKQLDLPDLTVTIQKVSVNCSGPGSCFTSIAYRVSNLGRAASPKLKILIHADPDVVDTRSAGPVSPAKPVSLAARLGPGANCFDPDCTVRITVDPGDAVLETNEQNNAATSTTPG